MKVYKRRSSQSNIVLLPAIIAYLKRQGWREVPSSNSNAAIYHGPLDIYGKPLVAVLPAHEDLEDTERRINDVVRMLTTLEAKQHNQLVREIIGAKSPRRAKRAYVPLESPSHASV